MLSCVAPSKGMVTVCDVPISAGGADPSESVEPFLVKVKLTEIPYAPLALSGMPTVADNVLYPVAS